MEIMRDPASYKTFPVGSGMRLTYQKNGVVCDIRFRRQVRVDDSAATVLEHNIGYVGLK